MVGPFYNLRDGENGNKHMAKLSIAAKATVKFRLRLILYVISVSRSIHCQLRSCTTDFQVKKLRLYDSLRRKKKQLA